MSDKALIYGTIAIDTLITPAGRANSVLGGSGIYAALAARLVTSDMALVGVVGTDFDNKYRLAMEARGVSMPMSRNRRGRPSPGPDNMRTT